MKGVSVVELLLIIFFFYVTFSLFQFCHLRAGPLVILLLVAVSVSLTWYTLISPTFFGTPFCSELSSRFLFGLPPKISKFLSVTFCRYRPISGVLICDMSRRRRTFDSEETRQVAFRV